MTLLERIIYFRRAACSQDDERTDEELINAMTPFELLSEISGAIEFSDTPTPFNTKW